MAPTPITPRRGAVPISHVGGSGAASIIGGSGGMGVGSLIADFARMGGAASSGLARLHGRLLACVTRVSGLAPVARVPLAPLPHPPLGPPPPPARRLACVPRVSGLARVARVPLAALAARLVGRPSPHAARHRLGDAAPRALDESDEVIDLRIAAHLLAHPGQGLPGVEA